MALNNFVAYVGTIDSLTRNLLNEREKNNKLTKTIQGQNKEIKLLEEINLELMKNLGEAKEKNKNIITIDLTDQENLTKKRKQENEILKKLKTI